MLSPAQLEDIRRALAPTIVKLASEYEEGPRPAGSEKPTKTGAPAPSHSTGAIVAHGESASKNRHPSGWPIVDAVREVPEELLFEPELGDQCLFCGGWGEGTCACTEAAR